jgi:hypothetical protein
MLVAFDLHGLLGFYLLHVFGKNYMDNTPILRMFSELNEFTVFFQ